MRYFKIEKRIISEKREERNISFFEMNLYKIKDLELHKKTPLFQFNSARFESNFLDLNRNFALFPFQTFFQRFLMKK